MKFTLSWLKDYLETDASLEIITNKLTSIGLEVEKIENHGEALAPFIIAYVVSAEKHPQADRLKVCTVDTGKEKLQVVCGAPNAHAGMKTVLARPGDVMPDTGEALKKGVIRGVESQGMLCAADELKLSDRDEDGIIELPADAPTGENFARYSKLDDPIIEINLTPNRSDCAGVYGIARDLAASGLGHFKALKIKSIPGKEPSRVKVALQFPVGDMSCPIFSGRLIRNIKNKPSPAWLQQRLIAIGQRPISSLVDITNYVTFDAGRPLHVFDAKKIKGTLWVKPAVGGEKFKALNGKDYVLETGMTIIGDDTGVLSLAGIMGGITSSCDEETTDVFIESAYFDASRTAHTGRALQITSDARYRFERGVDPAFVIAGIELATQLILDFCGTPETIISNLVIEGQEPKHERTLTLDGGKCQKHTGVSVPLDEQETILTHLGFRVKKEGHTLKVSPPSWRPDVTDPTDLVEEIIRIKGYDLIEAQSIERTTAVTEIAVDTIDKRAAIARRSLASQGLYEAVTWSFMAGPFAQHFGGNQEALRLLNPISSDLDVMRPSVIGNLIQAAKRNADRGIYDVALFEVGPIFRGSRPEDQINVATTLRAGKTPRHWAEASRDYDTFDAKADVLAALKALGAPLASLQVTTDAPAWYHPGRSGALRLGPNVLAYFGDVHPEILQKVGADGPMVASEIFFESIPEPRSTLTAKPLLKEETLQTVVRDFAFVVGRDISASKLIKAIRDADKNLIRDVTVFDVYEGEKMEPNKKSVALSVTLQPQDKTLTEPEIDTIVKKISESVSKTTGAVLRA